MVLTPILKDRGSALFDAPLQEDAVTMRKPFVSILAATAGVAVTVLAARTAAQGPKVDFGAWVESQIAAHAEQLFGFTHPLEESALGPFDGDSVQALDLAKGLRATLISSSVHHSADQIAMWPDDEHPTHLFVCDEESSNPAVQRVNLSAPAGSNATTIVTGLSACDPVRRTPWGTIVVGEEAGILGGLYEIIDPMSINTAVNVSNRDVGTTSNAKVVKRKAVGSLSWESLAIRPDGTMIYGDELAPIGGANGGGIYKFVPDVPFLGGGAISDAAQSPFASGKIYGLRVAGAASSTNWGQGAETGKGKWDPVDTVPVGVVDANSNIKLRNAQAIQKFTGFYRPEDMDIDPIARENGVFRACWANTGRMSNGGGSLVETSAVLSEIMCLVEEPVTPSAAQPTGTIPVVERFIPGDRQFNHFDNVAFQPFTGNLVVLEDSASLNVVTPSGTEQRGDDMIICLPDGADHDTQSDGCVRFASLRDTTSEPTGFIFLASGEEAFVSLQHRGTDESHGRGSLLKISGFKIQ